MKRPLGRTVKPIHRFQAGDPCLSPGRACRLLCPPDFVEHSGARAVGDDHAFADAGRRSDGLELGLHPADPSQAAAGGGQPQQRIVPLVDERNQLAGGRLGIAVIQAVDNREDDQQRLGQQPGDHRGELVVIAELDLGHADGVVLIDDGDRFVFEQRVQRVADVEIARAALEVVGREQHLGGMVAVLAQAIVVEANEVGLSRWRPPPAGAAGRSAGF